MGPELVKNEVLLKLGKGKDVRKQCDGAEIQNRNDCSHGHFFTCMKSVHFFHGTWI